MKNTEIVTNWVNKNENKDADIIMDSLCLGNLYILAENTITDRKLKEKILKCLEGIADEFKERDLEEEAKTEFYCKGCFNYKKIEEQSEDKYKCKKCHAEDELEEEDYD